MKQYKEELIEKARVALLSGDKEIDGYTIYTAKIDLDEKLCGEDILYWEQSRRVVIEYYVDGIIIDINTTETDRGMHTVINYLCGIALHDEELNFIQLLLGDDVVRYKINKRRIERGISFERANILFSQILKRYPHEEDSKIKIALEREIGEL